MQRGYVKLWRKSLDSGLLQNHKLWVFWTWCLMKATHKRTKQPVGMQVINLDPGQFIFGRKKAAAETGLSERNVRTCINTLKNLENLTIKTTNKFSVITIVNWDTYQQEDAANDQQTTSKRPASDHKQEHKNNIYTPNFLKFWSAYPKKVGKGAALKAYQNIKEPRPSLSVILNSLTQQGKSEQWRDKQFIPNPATWLNQRRWEDELECAEPKEKIIGMRIASSDC